MFAYPKQAEFNRVVPKTKIFAHAHTGRRLRDLFAAQVDQIIWKYKLAPETINLPARGGITEIQVFEILLKSDDLHPDVLTAIDKAIPFPILFQVVRGTSVQFVASYKRPSEADATRWVIEATFQTPRQPLDSPRPPLPVSLDLAALHESLIRHHLPLPPRAGESLRDHVGRFRAIQEKEKQCQQLETRLKQEKQFNRKVDLNAQLRTARLELDTLLHP